MEYLKNALIAFVILIYSVFKMDKNYYPQVFLENHKYIIKVEKDDLKTLPYDSDEETDESDESDKKAYDKE